VKLRDVSGKSHGYSSRAPASESSYRRYLRLWHAVVSLIAVLVGFAPTYFLAGVFRAPVPNLLIHVHGAVFTLGSSCSIPKQGLVATRRLALHRRIGLLAFGFAVLMVVLGVLAASDRLARQVGESANATPEDVHAFYAIPMGDMLMFATFISLGYSHRSNPTGHKGFMCLRPLHFWTPPSITGPFSLPAAAEPDLSRAAVLLTTAYDWRSSGRVQRVTICRWHRELPGWSSASDSESHPESG
jgi:hypothetical protein